MTARPGIRPSEMESRIVDPLNYPGYAKLIDKLPSSLFLSPQWLKVLKATYDFNPEAIIIAEAGEEAACLPFVRISDPSGKRLCALSFSDYCDPAFTNPRHASALFQALAKLDQERAVNIRLLNSPDPDPKLGYKKVKTAAWHGLDLSVGLERLQAGLYPTFRSSIQKARRSGLKIRRLEKTELRLFYRLHLTVRKNRHRLLAQPFSFFANIWNVFMDSGLGFFLGAFLADTLVACHCYIPWKNILVFKFGASDYKYRQLYGNNLLNWSAIEEAVKSGFALLDTGLSDQDQPGLIRYKRHLGASEKEIRFFRYVPEKYWTSPGWSQALKKITEAATAKSAPDYVTEQAGNIFYRFFA